MIGPLMGGIAAGLVVLAIIIIIIVRCYRRRKLNQQALANSQWQNNPIGLSIMTNNTPQPVYRMNQPMPMTQPVYSQLVQPGYNPVTGSSTYINQLYPINMGLGYGQTRNGPILY
jgi:hypothetical protein